MMKISEVNFGSIDAKHEVDGRTPEEIRYFEDSYVLPPNINLDDYLDGKKYYISGLKGTGKTALLRFIQIKADKANFKTSFILFKSEFDSYERASLHNSIISSTPEPDATINQYDYEQAWRMYIYKTIVSLTLSDKIDAFQKNKIWSEFRDLILAISPGNIASSVSLPKVTAGKVVLSKDPKFEFDFEMVDKKKVVNFSEYCKVCDEKYKELITTDTRNIIFVDELEIRVLDDASTSRDIHLVRDLITTVDRLNQISRKQSFNINFILAVRSEVMQSARSIGKEINKPLFDFGDTLAWSRFSKDKKHHPLVKIIESRIIATEKRKGINKHGDIWDKYFKGNFHGRDFREFALDQTWYRPRDLVRLMEVALKSFKGLDYLLQSHFDESKKLYSSESWIEIGEELSASMTAEEIEGISRVLGKFRHPFTIHEFKTQVTELASIYSEVDKLDQNNKTGELLKKLYTVGVIGNYITGRKGNKIPQYAARDNPIVHLEEQFIVHPAVKPFFSTNL
ncbi:P-loop ATPase, Sll1717 family [Enterobacter mori]|uniref:P-loop ATPase, Sll1717 family n=1 Tax=Enterobacter mori TaxID=539813 RepID=UPI0030189955